MSGMSRGVCFTAEGCVLFQYKDYAMAFKLQCVCESQTVLTGHVARLHCSMKCIPASQATYKENSK